MDLSPVTKDLKTSDPSAKPLLAVLQGERRFPPPIWMMRQAGRYLPEYRAIRGNIAFLEIQFTDFVALFVCPHCVHTHEHTGPVAGFCSAGSGCDLKNRR